jgi:hypothetical protein
MALPAANINLVPPPQISACVFCGARALGAERPFVAFDGGVDDDEMVPARLVETVDDQPGVRAYRSRDAFGRGSSTIAVVKPMACGDCITTAAGLIGLEDVTPLRAEADELRAEFQRVQADLAQATAEKTEAEDALREPIPRLLLEATAPPPDAPGQQASQASGHATVAFALRVASYRAQCLENVPEVATHRRPALSRP